MSAPGGRLTTPPVRRFEAGKHFIRLEGPDLREFKRDVTKSHAVKITQNANVLLLWTERGAARHAKMLDTDQAWEVFERLEDAYFRVPEPAKPKAVESGWPKLLPEPADPLTPEVRRAINRKAHALSLAAFEHNREYLEAWVRRLSDAYDPIPALERVHQLDLDHGQHVLVNLQELVALTACIDIVERQLVIGKHAV